MLKLVIFDLDGTLVNSIADLADATNRALEENGYPTHPLDNYRYYVGNGTRKLIERAMPQGTDPQELEPVPIKKGAAVPMEQLLPFCAAVNQPTYFIPDCSVTS